MPGCRPWAPDRCPPAPLVLAGDLCLPAGTSPAGAQHLVGDVLAVGPTVTAAHRATALTLVLSTGHGVVVRATAAWVWSGEPSLRPARADLAVPRSAPALPGPRRPPAGALPVRRARWVEGSRWAVLAGVAVTPPTATAADCARLLPAPLARRCVEALLPLVEPDEVLRLLRAGAGQGPPAPPGTSGALALLGTMAAR